jgi:hypothetical protein
MAGSKTAYLSQKILDHVLGQVTYTPPTHVFLVFSTAAYDPNATGVACNECVAGDYARVSFINDLTIWTSATAAAPSEKHQIADMAFATATSTWGTPLAWYLADALTAGNLLYGADNTDPALVNSGDTPRIPAGAFVLNED